MMNALHDNPPTPSLRIGTRGSALARAQADQVAAALTAAFPSLTVEIVIVSTRGDQDLSTPLHRFGNAGVFVRELEEALLDGRVDLAVHSLKDMPVRQPEGLVVRPAMMREDPRDALVTRDGRPFGELPDGARVGTSSLRRTAALRAMRGDVQVLPVRGNVNTRLAKLDAGEYDALLMATAGLERLGMASRIATRFSPDDMTPAPAQGILG
ncbi:MAG: hydroxymethylbilane synthase, partial [Planctomycetota bacterium]